MQSIKGKYWGFIFYPESMNSWEIIEEKLIQYGYRVAISPLHDKDVDENGQNKKPHYHGIIVFNNTTTETYANKVCSEVFASTRVVLLGSVRSMYRYHCHEDDSSKFHYNNSDRRFYNGFNIIDFSFPTESEQLGKQIEADLYVKESGITEYSDLIYSLIDNGDFELYKFVTSHSIHYNALLRSLRCKERGVEKY